MKLPVRILLLLLSCASSVSVIAQADGDDPVSLVIKTTNSIFTEVDKNFESYESNPATLQDLVRTDLIPLLDVHYSARLILGRAGRGIEKEKVDEFAEAMISLLVNRYSNGLLQFRSQEPVMVLPQRGDLNEKLTRVRTRVKRPTGGEAPIDYAFHKTIPRAVKHPLITHFTKQRTAGKPLMSLLKASPMSQPIETRSCRRSRPRALTW